MDDKPRCQSCGMPLGYFTMSDGAQAHNYGTNDDESENHEYCKFCFQNGKFVEENLTLSDMIEKSVGFMTSEFKMSEEKAHSLSQQVISNLKRWAN